MNVNQQALKVPGREHGYESTLKAVDESLERFGFGTHCIRGVKDQLTRCDTATPWYLDLFLIHSPTSGKEKRLETWRALIEARDAGKLRSIGVSN